MLERYFFASFVPLIIILFSEVKILPYFIIIWLATFLNLLYSFFRRTVGEISDFFTLNNFLVIRVLSITVLFSYAYLIKKFFVKASLRKV